MKHARQDYARIQDPHNLIPEEEPVFLLRAQDATAPGVLRYWAEEAEAAGASREITEMVLTHANLMEKWQKEVKVKVPDLPE